MINTKDKKTLKKFHWDLGISPRKNTSLSDYAADLKRIVFFSDIGIFLILLIQILQEFASIIYLNHLLVFIGIIELVLFLVCRALYSRFCLKEKENILANWESSMSFHTNFVLSIFVPMIFFFDSDIISFAGTRVTNVTLLKECLVLFAFLSLPIDKFIKWRLEQTSLNKSNNETSSKSESTFTKTKTLCFAALGYDMFLFYSIFTLILGMMNKDERLGTFVLGAAFTLGIVLVIPLLVTDEKKLLQRLFLTLFVIFSSFMLYEQYLIKMDTSYDFHPSVYHTSMEVAENNLEIYCQFTDSVPNEQLTYYFLFRKEDGTILYHAIAEYDFHPYKWRKGIFTWYDSSFTKKLPKRNVEKNAVPIELCFLTESVSYSPDFPEAYKKYVLGTEYTYTGPEEHTTDLFLLSDNGHGWFRGFALEPIPMLPEEIAALH